MPGARDVVSPTNDCRMSGGIITKIVLGHGFYPNDKEGGYHE